MLASLNAIGIILVVMFTIYMLYKYGSNKLTVRQTVMAFFITIAILMFDSVFLVTMCSRGNPLFQWLIPSVAIFFVLVSITDKSIRIKTALAIFIISIVLSFHYKYLVETKIYIGQSSLNIDGEKTITKSYAAGYLDDEAKKQYDENSSVKYDEGWITEVFVKINTYDSNDLLYEAKLGELWHSSFSGLYEDLKGSRINLWYKGGYLKEDNENMIEFREYK